MQVYSPGTVVEIDYDLSDSAVTGIVESVQIDTRGVLYNCEWWHGGELVSGSFDENRLTARDGKQLQIGFF